MMANRAVVPAEVDADTHTQAVEAPGEGAVGLQHRDVVAVAG